MEIIDIENKNSNQNDTHTYVRGKHFVPSRVFGSINISGGLIHCMTNSNSAIWVHASESIVSHKLCL